MLSDFKYFRSTHETNKQEKSQSRATKPEFWNPFWLSRSLLGSVSVASLALLAALVALLVVSKSNDGVKVISNHYVRTYTPTAILILLSAIWRQVDFHCKHLTPWAVLYRGESAADTSVLLDYVSPIQIKSFTTALRNRNLPVVCTITGFTILKVLIVASTALFTAADLALPTSSSTTQKRPLAEGLDIDINELRDFGPAIAYEAYGISSQGLAQRPGVTDAFIYETIDVPKSDTTNNVTLQTQVRSLSPVFECQNAPFQILFPPSNSTDINPDTRVELLFPECTLRGGDGRGTAIFSLNPSISKTPARQLSPLRQQIDCLNQTDDNWQLLTLVEFLYNQTLDDDDQQAVVGDTVQARSWFTNVERTAGVACRSTYKLGTASLTYNTDDTGGQRISIERKPTTLDDRLQSFRNFDVGDVADSALRAGASMAGRLEKSSFDEEYPNTLFKIMAGVADGTYDSLFVKDMMGNAAQTAYQQIALQALDRHLRQSDAVSSPANVTVVERRLKVNEVAAIVTITGFGLLSLLSAALIALAPRNVTKQNPELLASAAAVLQDSPMLQRTLEGTKSSNMKLKEGLKGLKFASGLGYSQLPRARCGILISKDGEASPLMSNDRAPDESTQAEARWYRPVTTRKRLAIPLLLLPVALIGALEAVQRVSDSNDGIATVADPTNPIIALLPQVLSALVMLSVAAAFSSIEFNTLAVAPMHHLHRGSKSDSEGLLTTYLGRSPPVVLLTSLLRQDWAVLLITTSALIGSLLTLVASGLYTVRDLDGSQALMIQQQDRLDAVWVNSALNDSDASVILSLVEGTDLGYSAFTYDELAFPGLQTKDFSVENASQVALFEASIPALRASLDCTPLDDSAYNFTPNFNSRIRTASAQISASIQLPSDCQLGGSAGNESSLDFTDSVTLTANDSFIGKLLDLHVGPFDPIRGGATGELDPSRQADNPATCPTLAFWYGHASLSNPTETTATLLVCYQQLYTLNTTTTFTLNNMSISPAHPPRITESSAQILPYPNATAPNTPYRPQLHFANTFAPLDTFTPGGSPRCSFRDQASSESANATFDTTNPALDPFFQGVLCGRPALPVETLAQTDADSRARVLAAVQAFYRRYMAIAISKNMRVPLAPPTPADVQRRQASATTENHPMVVGASGQVQGRVLNARKVVRLVQQGTPKVVLQAMLAAMAVGGALGVWLCRLWRPVVQYNPCSVAGKMVLFAGTGVGERSSGLWGCVDGMAVVTREELRGVWTGWGWRLGWCERAEGGGVLWGVEPVRVGPERKGFTVRDREGDTVLDGQEAEGVAPQRSTVRVVSAERGHCGWI